MMKNKNRLLGLLAFLLLLLTACNDDKSPVYGLQSAPEVEPLSNPLLVLNPSAADFIAETFSWTKGEYGFPAAPNYVLQVDNTSAFLDPLILAEAQRPYVPVTVGKLNVSTLILGGKAGEASTLYARVEARLTNQVKVYSEPIDFQVVPFEQPIEYPKLYVPGSHQGWSPDTAPFLTSLRMNNKYEGYIHLVNDDDPSASIEFKLLTQPSWSSGTEYGSGGGPGTLKEKGGNIVISPQGYYLLKVDLNSLTYTATLVESVSISGSASNVPQELRFDPTDGNWTGTVSFEVGNFRFVVNHDAQISYGDGDEDGQIDSLPNNDITIAASGRYRVTLDLNGYPFSYRLEKL